MCDNTEGFRTDELRLCSQRVLERSESGAYEQRGIGAGTRYCYEWQVPPGLE